MTKKIQSEEYYQKCRDILNVDIDADEMELDAAFDKKQKKLKVVYDALNRETDKDKKQQIIKTLNNAKTARKALLTLIKHQQEENPVNSTTSNKVTHYIKSIKKLFKNFKLAILDDNELDSDTLKLLSLFFLLLSGAMSLIRYTDPGFISYFDDIVNIKPDPITSMISLALVTPLYLRGVLKWNKSIYSIISFILILLVFASFVQLAMGGADKSDYVMYLLVAAVVLSWLGIKIIAGTSWIVVFGVAAYSAISGSNALGFAGFIYITSGFLGLVLHSGLNPGDLLNTMKEEYSPGINNLLNTAKQDVGDMGSDINDAVDIAIKKVL